MYRDINVKVFPGGYAVAGVLLVLSERTYVEEMGAGLEPLVITPCLSFVAVRFAPGNLSDRSRWVQGRSMDVARFLRAFASQWSWDPRNPRSVALRQVARHLEDPRRACAYTMGRSSTHARMRRRVATGGVARHTRC